jgi:hypothetical protein
VVFDGIATQDLQNLLVPLGVLKGVGAKNVGDECPDAEET